MKTMGGIYDVHKGNVRNKRKNGRMQQNNITL